MSIADATVSEGGNLQFEVLLTAPLDVDAVITYSTADDSAITADNDYTAQTAQTLTILAGQTSGTITVTTTPDNTVELDETINVNLTAVAATGRNVVIGASRPPLGSVIADLALWLDASDINADGTSLLDGAAVTTWQDKSGNDRDLILGGGAGNDPSFALASPHGQ